MHRGRQHAHHRLREHRQRVAHEAARLIAEGGVGDFHQARLKAAARLGIHDDASLPRDHEIGQALREYQRIFLGDAHALALRQRREAAVRAMEFFAGFEPRLLGPVLEGTADSHSPVLLHLHGNDPEAVARFLHEHRIPAETRTRRLRLNRERSVDLPVWLFGAEGLEFDATVLPLLALRQAPLPAADDKPMRRASLAQLRQLLAQGELAQHP